MYREARILINIYSGGGVFYHGKGNVRGLLSGGNVLRGKCPTPQQEAQLSERNRATLRNYNTMAV